MSDLTFDTCILPSCGNGYIEGSEQCDDGNAGSGDGGSSTCILEWSNCTTVATVYQRPNRTKGQLTQDEIDSLSQQYQNYLDSLKQKEEETQQAADNQAKSSAAAATGIASTLMMLQSLKDINPSPTMWAFVNWIQIIRPITLLQTNVTTALSDFLNKDMKMFSFKISYFENIANDVQTGLENLIGTSKFNIPSSFSMQGDSYNFEIGKFVLFLITNILTLFSLFFLFALLYFVSLGIVRLKSKRIRDLGAKLMALAWNSLFFNLSIRVFQEIILEAFLHILVFLRFFDPTNGLTTNLLGILLSLGIFATTIFVVVYFAKKLRDPFKWSDRFKELYDNMTFKGTNVSIYFIFFFIKRFTIALAVALVGIVPAAVQNFMILGAHFTSLALNVIYPPFDHKFDMAVLLLLEVSGIMYSIPLFYFDSLMPEKRLLGRWLVQLFMVIQISVSVLGFAKIAYDVIIKRCIKKRVQKAPDNSDLNNKSNLDRTNRTQYNISETDHSHVRINWFKNHKVKPENSEVINTSVTADSMTPTSKFIIDPPHLEMKD